MESNEKQNGPMDDPKIVIIGAGIAGIAAGNKLSKEGFADFKIFEASDRIGGRIWSVVTDEEGNKAEMGANWIHGVENNPIYEIANENHLLQMRHKDKSLRSKDVFIGESGDVVGDRLVKEVDLIYGLLLTQCENFFANNMQATDDDSVGQFLQRKFAEKVDRYANGERHVRDLIFGHRKLLECCISGCDTLDEVALQDFGSYENLPGIHYTIPPGFDTILDILRKDIPKDNIVFNSPVRCINWDLGPESKYPVCVELETGEKHYANHVIVTVSLGVLKAACDRMFTPSLPTQKVQAINGLGYGIVDKVFLEFEEPIVGPDIFRLNILWDEDEPHEADLRHCWYRKIYSFEVVHERILVGWLSGKEALFMESLTEEQIGEDCVEVLKKMLKKDIPPPVRVIRTRWGTNPLTRGSYSFIKVGSSQEDVTELSKPLKSKGQPKPSVLFGGEATHPRFYSTTHGALLTGYREANRIVKMYTTAECRQPDTDEDSDDNEDNGLKMSF
ncbi:spermine oxidase-like isoform X2 [Littorina saxatilis]|uniref:Amine oxidase domain-containing protein n=1 Tax=Littorina saxatilis TaxID=31220 RepID=A0AAN9GIG9_9CAEN